MDKIKSQLNHYTLVTRL